ncbi:MAG: hypothetical protein WCO56_16260 [Verrucomicrobiota bacterium]
MSKQNQGKKQQVSIPNSTPNSPQTDQAPEQSENNASDSYLNLLRENEYHAIDQFDKTVLTLAGGAFALSFAFLKDIIRTEQIQFSCCLICAWIFWVISLASTLSSFYFAHLAMRNAQRLWQKGIKSEKKLRGNYGKAIPILNLVSGIAFLFGLISMTVFVTNNLSHEQKSLPASTNNITNNQIKTNEQRTTTSTNTPSSATKAAAAATKAAAASPHPTN